MAFERLTNRTTIATNLNAFVQSSLVLMANQRAQQNARREADFLTSVLEDNLSLQDQIEWRESQMAEVAPNDKDERIRIRKEIASLRDRKEMQEFTDGYLQELMDFNTGAQSIDATIGWLNDRLTRTTDINVKNKIKEQLNELKTQQYTLRKNVLERQTMYANEDKSESVLQSQIQRVSQERKNALLTGNDDYVSVLDLQLQSLRKTVAESRISKIATDMSVSTMTGQSALSMLNHFNQMISSAASDTPITIGGTRYESEQDFWSVKRGEYLNDNTANGFFGRYTNELKEKVDYKQSRSVLKNSDMADVNNWYEGIKDRPELAGYEEKIMQEQQRTLKYSADLKANDAINQFVTDLDAVKAVNTLSYLQDNYGVNLTSQYQKVIQVASQEKETQVQQLLSTMGQIMQNNPGVSQEQALKQAVASGAGVMFSAEELATQSATDIITQAGEKATSQEFGDTGSRVTIPTKQAETFQPGADFQEGGLYKTGDSSTVYKYEGGQLRPFSGAWNEDKFKQATGKAFSDVEVVTDIGGAQTGTAIKDTDFNFTTQQQQPQQQATSQPQAQQPAQPNVMDYKIQSGDTLSRIASRNKTTVDEIMKLNTDIKDPNKIFAGATLKLPNQQ